MKTIMYILAAIGLMFLGAFAKGLLASGSVHEVNSDWVERVEFIPDSGPGWAVPTPTAIGVAQTGSAAMSAVPLISLMAMLVVAALIALRWKLKEEQQEAPADSAQMQALFRQAKSLEQRMESLETILLNRDRTL